MTLRRLVTTLAAAAVLATAGGCSKQTAESAADGKQSVGAKIDRALDTTQEKLGQAGERAKEEIGEAAQKTQETLSKAGEKISTATSNAVNDAKQSFKGQAAAPSSPPYSPRQAVTDTAAAAPAPAPAPAASQGSTASTASTMSSGPTTSLKRLGLSKEARDTLSDAAIIASIKAGFLADPGLSVLKIDVDANDGVVTLNGLAADEAAKQRAERSAGSVKGVKEVRNYLTVKQM